MKQIAIIGASYLQLPLIKKAKEMGLITHVFAWKKNDVGEYEADYFYPISIIEKESILAKCQELEIDGICSIASDLAICTVNFVAQNMGLLSNSINCTELSTNKFMMRNAFMKNNDPSPMFQLVGNINEFDDSFFNYPLIVKPIDRSGSRGIIKVDKKEDLKNAISFSLKEGFIKKVLIEEFVEGNEYSVECISWKGEHHFLSITKKYTSGSPHFIETGHLEPSGLDKETVNKIIKIVFHALDSLEIEYGASHSEIKIDKNGNIKIIEIGGRMGGDFIGSSLVKESTGFDFVKAVIEISLGTKPNFSSKYLQNYCGVKFVFGKRDVGIFEKACLDQDIKVIDYFFDYPNLEKEITDSSNRHGYFIIQSDKKNVIDGYLD